MFFLSTPLFRSKSKRRVVQLVSAAQTGYLYATSKSPLSKATRMALKKYDPVVNTHVMFYETKLPTLNRHRISTRPLQFSRFTGERNGELLRAVEKKAEKKGYLKMKRYGTFQDKCYHD